METSSYCVHILCTIQNLDDYFFCLSRPSTYRRLVVIFCNIQMTSVERIVALSHLESEGEWHGHVSVPASWPELGLITAEGVSFRYHPTLPRVLKNMNFCIRAQEKVFLRRIESIRIPSTFFPFEEIWLLNFSRDHF